MSDFRKRLPLVMTGKQVMRAIQDAHMAVNSDLWGPYFPTTVQCVDFRCTKRDDGRFDAVAEFREGAPGMHEVEVFDRTTGQKCGPFRMYSETAFADIFGPDPQFEPEPVGG